MLFLEFIAFFILSIIVFYLPGRYLLRLFYGSFEHFSITVSTSLSISIASFLLGTYLFSYLHLACLYNILLVIPLMFEGRATAVEVKKNISLARNILPLILILLGSLAMTFVVGGSGALDKNGNMLFYGANINDGIYHISIVNGMLNSFPPQLLAIAGLPLRGYHFFYDFLIANFVNFYKFSLLDLLFRVFPFFLAIYYGLAFFAISRFYRMEKFATAILIFLAYFAGSLTYLLPVIFRKPIPDFNTGLNPLIINIINPSVLLSIGILFSFYILIFSKSKKSSFLLAALLIGILPEIKIYGAVLAYVALGVCSIISYIKFKNWFYVKVLFIGGIISAIVFLPFNLGSTSIVFAPFVLYSNFFQEFSAFNKFPWILQFQVYQIHGNLPHLLLFAALAAGLYFLPTLGVRLVIITAIKDLFKKNFYTLGNIFWLVFVLTSVVIMSLFIESIDIFNNVQFLWFSYIIILVPTALVVSNISKKFSYNKSLMAAVLFIVIILLSLPDVVNVWKTYSMSPTKIPKNFVKISEYINKNVPSDQTIIVLSQVGKNGINTNFGGGPIVSALTGHKVYVESTLTPFANAISEANKRQKIIDSISSLLNVCDISSQKNAIDQIMSTGSSYILTFSRNGCLEKISKLKLISQNANFELFQLK